MHGGPVRNRTGIAGLGNRCSILLSYGAATELQRQRRVFIIAAWENLKLPECGSPFIGILTAFLTRFRGELEGIIKLKIVLGFAYVAGDLGTQGFDGRELDFIA